MSKRLDNKKVPSEHFNNYKGIHFNDKKDSHFIDDETGAHFDFMDLCNRLALLNRSKAHNEPSQNMRSNSSDKNKIIQNIPNSQINNIASKPLINNDKLIKTTEKVQNKSQIKNVCIKLTDLSKKVHPNTSHSTKKCAPNLLKTIDSMSCKKLFSPQNKNSNSLKGGFSGFNFKSLDNRKSVDLMKGAKLSNFIHCKSSSQRYPNGLFSMNMALSPSNQKK